MAALAAKRCLPCNSEHIQLLSEEAANNLLEEVDGWSLLNENGTLKIQKTWVMKSFSKGMELFQLVADVAEGEGHHPDLHLVGWNNVKIEIFTHSIGGLTESDFILAAKINNLNVDHLVRKRVATQM